MSKTHIWKDLVSSDKQLIEEEQPPRLFNRKGSRKNSNKMSLKLSNNNNKNNNNDIQTPTTKATSPTSQKLSHTGNYSSKIPAIDEDVPLMSTTPPSGGGGSTGTYSAPVPQIVVFNSRTPAQSPIQENQTKL